MAIFVVDASVALAWCFEDEATVWSDALLDRLKAGDEAIVPALWPVEVANAVLMGVRRRRISGEKARRFFEDLRALPIHIDYHKSLKSECIRPGTPLSLEDARRLVEGYVERYNNVRLNSAIGYITPKDVLAGRQQAIHADRDRKLEAARQQRQSRRQVRMISRHIPDGPQVPIQSPQNKITRNFPKVSCVSEC
jgi:hypothetical protein